MARRWLPIIVFLLALTLYLRTLVPDIYVSDFVEFQYQPSLLGLPHPNGFPFYMVLGWLWSHVPMGSVAWRMNVLSAIGGALAVALTASFAQRVSRRVSVGVLAGGLLALSPAFWYYALAAERYTLNIALLAGVFWSAWEASQRLRRQDQETGSAGPDPEQQGRAARLVYLSGLLLGLGLATHPSDALIGPFWLMFLVWRLPALRSKIGFWVKLAVATAAPLLLFIYVPWRWHAFSGLPLAPGVGRSSAVYEGLVHVWYEPRLTLDLLRNYIMGLGGYATRFLMGGWQDAIKGTWVLEPYWSDNVAPLLLGLACLGALRLLWRDAALALAMVGAALLMALMTAYITQGKNDAYLTPTFWVIFFCAAFSLDLLLAGMQRLGLRQSAQAPGESPGSGGRGSGFWADGLGLLAVAGVLLVLLWHRYPESDLSRWTDTRRDWEVALAHPLESQAGVLAHWSDLTPLWYIQHVEGKRPDLLGLFPPDPATVIQPWLEQGKALYLAAPLNEYAPDLGQRYRLVPWGKTVRILLPDQQASCPPLPHTVDTPAAWPFAVTSWDVDTELSSDAPGTLRFCWQAREQLPPDTFLSLRLRWLEGDHAVNINQPLLSEWLPKSTIAPGGEGMAVVGIELPLGTPPGAYAAEIVPYRLHEDDTIGYWPGVEAISLGETTVAPSLEFHRAQLADETVPVVPLQAGPLTLRAWRVSDQPVRPGDPVQVELLWQVREPLQDPSALQLAIGFRPRRLGQETGQSGSETVVQASQPAVERRKQFELQPLSLPKSAQPGTLVRTVHSVRVPRGRGDESYWVEPSLQSDGHRLPWLPTGWLLIGDVRVKDRPHLEAPPASAAPAIASFGDVADLVDFELEPAALHPGGALSLTLDWQPRAETGLSYAVFVHLLDGAGNIVAQHDGRPAEGTLPTDIWLPGEVIVDTHRLFLPAGLPPGDYTLQIGMYDPSSMQRLPITSGQPVQDAAVTLDRPFIQP